MWWRDPWARASREPRRWQREVIDTLRTSEWDRGVITAIMGAGKTAVTSEIATSLHPSGGGIIISVPSVRLCEQTSADITAVMRRYRPDARCGVWYGDAKDLQRITVVCVPSLPTVVEAMRERGWSWRAWIADEAHRTDHTRVVEALSVMQPELRIGLSATPYHADDSGLSQWGHEVYRYTAADALRDGVLVPYVPHFPEGKVVVDEWCLAWAREQEGPGIVSAASIADAEAYAAWLRDRGYPAEAVHSESRDVGRAIHRLRDGTVRALVHVRLLSEGVDMPWLRWMVLRDPRGSRVEVAQSVGRVLRACPGKDVAHIADPHYSLAALDLAATADFADAWSAPRRKTPDLSAVLTAPAEVRMQAALDALGAARSTAQTPLRMWMRRMLLVLGQEIDVKPATLTGDASVKQIKLLERAAAWGRNRYSDIAPPALRLLVEVLAACDECAQAGRLRKTVACDAISLWIAYQGSPERFARVHEVIS